MKPSDERSKQISESMRPYRKMRKLRGEMMLSPENISLKMVYSMIKEGSLKNSKQNRDPLWSVPKSQSYIFALYIECTAPKDFLLRETECEDEDTHSELHIYDGSNRLKAIENFFENRFTISFGTCKVYYKELSDYDKSALHNVVVQFVKLRNCPESFACEIAEKRNEGTPMTIGEKTGLLISVDTPRSKTLDELMAAAPFMNMPDDRASGLKIVAQLLQSIEMKRGVHESNFKLTDYHFDAMRNFYKASDVVAYSDIMEKIIKAFVKVGEFCEDDGGSVPKTINDSMTLLNGKKKQTRIVFFYLSVAALVMDHLRNGAHINEKALMKKFEVLLNRSVAAKESGTPFSLTGVAIENMY